MKNRSKFSFLFIPFSNVYGNLLIIIIIFLVDNDCFISMAGHCNKLCDFLMD